MNYIERYWRDAKPEDAIKEPPMVARFSNGDGWVEKELKLVGWSRFHADSGSCLWYGDGVGCYTHCQVYDAPDPGEGWRLLDVGERLQEGDQFYNSVADWVGVCLTWSSGVVLKGSVYRRRIAPQYVPYTWDDREELRGRWYRHKEDNSEHMVRDVRVDSCDGDVMCVNGMTANYFFENCEWLDGTPCGKVVE